MQKKFITRTAILIGILATPSIVLATSATDAIGGITGFSNIVNSLNGTLVKSIATLFLSLGLIAFFYGIVMFIWGSREGKPDQITAGKTFMGWGLVALFVMFSVYGIIKMTQGVLFNNTDVTTITIPDVNFGGGTGGANINTSSADYCQGKAANTPCSNGAGVCNGLGTCVIPSPN